MEASTRQRMENIVRKVLHKNLQDFTIVPMKNGMTNDSYRLDAEDASYVLRLNGIGTEKLIDRENEVAAYKTLAPFSLADDVLALSVKEGYKISYFLQNVHPCCAQDRAEVQRCMAKLRQFHEERLPYRAPFDILRWISFYEQLWKAPSRHADYAETKRQVFALKPLQALGARPLCLCHIDAVADNFLISADGGVRLIDWEYAAGCDPLMDPAMFAIYASYGRAQSAWLLETYAGHRPSADERYRFAAYMAAGGLLWSNWCEYKEDLGETFGSYAAQQYAYAKVCVSWAREEA